MIRKSVAEILDQHVSFELEAIDRMYLNAYVPSLQTGGGVVYFMKQHLGARVPSTTMVAPLSERFVQAIERFVETEGLDLVTFKKGQRKDDVAQAYLASFPGDEGVLFVGKAQEKASVFRTEKRRRPDGSTYPWIYRSTTPVNHYYVYLLDRDFGPLFIKFCSYFPYAVKVCLNGHEWLKRQLTQRNIAFEALANGIRSTKDPGRVQRIANTLDAAKIDAVVRKWLRRLPHPFTAAHRAAGYRYQLSILQAEFALTQVLDRPREHYLHYGWNRLSSLGQHVSPVIIVESVIALLGVENLSRPDPAARESSFPFERRFGRLQLDDQNLYATTFSLRFADTGTTRQFWPALSDQRGVEGPALSGPHGVEGSAVSGPHGVEGSAVSDQRDIERPATAAN
jgi:hypothetical protein